MLHPEAPGLAGVHSGKAATDGSASGGWIAGRRVTGLRKRVTGLRKRKSISRRWGAGRAAPLRRDRREGLQAVGQAGKARARTAGSGKSEGMHTAPKRGRAGHVGAGASANANAGLHWGVNAGHTMWDDAGHTMRGACGPHNAGRMQTCEQTGRWGITGQVKWTTAPRTTRTKSRHGPSASLVGRRSGQDF